MSDMRLSTTPQVRETVSNINPPAINTNITPEAKIDSTQPQTKDKYNSSGSTQGSETPPVDERINFGGSIAAAVGAVLAVLSGGTNVDLKPIQDQLNKAGKFIGENGTNYKLGAFGNAESNRKLNSDQQGSERFKEMSQDPNKNTVVNEKTQSIQQGSERPIEQNTNEETETENS